MYHNPERGLAPNWHVWCERGAKEVLDKREHPGWLTEHPQNGYTINFANNTCARTSVGDGLWQALAEVAREFEVKVFPMGGTAMSDWTAWTGASNDLDRFECISIRLRRI